MPWFLIVMKLFGTISKLLKIAEQAFDDIPDSGVAKKQFVIDALKAAVEGMSGVVFTEELWAKIEKVCSLLIDAFCVLFFDSKTK